MDFVVGVVFRSQRVPQSFKNSSRGYLVSGRKLVFFGSSIISVGGCDGLSVVIGHGDWEFTGHEVEHVDEVALGAITAGFSLDG